MGLLDGDLREVFGSVFAPLLLNATISKPTLTADGAGGWLAGTPATSAAKGMVEEYSARERAQANIPSTDVKLIILQKDVELTPDLDCTVTIRGVIYAIQNIEQDPAMAAWTMQGRAQVAAPSGQVSVVALASAIAGMAGPSLVIPAPAMDAPIGSVGAPTLTIPMTAGAEAIAEAGTASIVAPSEPEILWTVTGQGVGEFDWTGQDVAEGDVIFCMMAGTTGHNDPAGSGTACGPVADDGFFYIHTPGSFTRTMSLSARIVTAGNIGDVVASRNHAGDSGIVFAVRGLDLAQLATSTGAGGYQWLTDTSLFAFAGGTNTNPPAITAGDGDLVLTCVNVWQSSPTITAPSGYTEDDVYTSTGGLSPSDRQTGVAHQIASGAGSKDPDMWGNFTSGSNSAAITLALAAA